MCFPASSVSRARSWSDDIQHGFAKGAHELPRIDRFNAADHAGAEVEAVLGVVEGDAVDQPSQDFGRRGCPWCFRHQGMMENKALRRYRDQGTGGTWRTPAVLTLFRWAVAATPLRFL